MSKQRYWHLCPVDKDGVARLGYDDGRQVKVGETLRVAGEPVLCGHGLHASKKLSDALEHIDGVNLSLCRVTLGGEIIHDDDKSCASARTVVVRLDSAATEELLRDYARWCALQVIDLWYAPSIVRQWLETGEESISDEAWEAAWSAAREAADAAAWSAAKAAACSAVKYAASSAARYAASYAASAAAKAEARYAAKAAAKAEYSEELERRGVAAMGQEPNNE